MQALFAAAEEGYCGLNLLDPVKALRTWSFGLDMQSGRLAETATLADGRRLTLPQYMRELCTVLLEMVSSGLIGEDIVPEAGELLPLVIELCTVVEGTHDPQRRKMALERLLDAIRDQVPWLRGPSGIFTPYGRFYIDLNQHFEAAFPECDSPYMLATLHEQVCRLLRQVVDRRGRCKTLWNPFGQVYSPWEEGEPPSAEIDGLMSRMLLSRRSDEIPF
ncbi:MAG: hypothetical protein HQ581_23350 [Planctomycetes bacterium]|nr:hypothetical protein [Planctomycetota bacterium]